MEKRKIATLVGFVVGSLALFLSIFFTVAHFTFQYYHGEKTFQKSGLSIILTNDFKEKEVLDYTAYYSSPKMMVLTLKVEMDGFDVNKWNPYESTCYDYAEKISKEYRNLYPSTTEVTVNEELIYFTFDFEQSGKTYKYLLAIYKANDAYWQVSFGCEKRNYDTLKKDMICYAKSVSIGD
ncbi:MAG: hypothetical protein IJX98_01815 [Clostridia bacterium]|nr:hypothetical protein [Clostridia bacterium]